MVKAAFVMKGMFSNLLILLKQGKLQVQGKDLTKDARYMHLVQALRNYMIM